MIPTKSPVASTTIEIIVKEYKLFTSSYIKIW